MNITIAAVGKLKEKFWKEACGEYLKRLSGYANVRISEVADADPARSGGTDGAKEKEAAALLSVIPDKSHVILLAIEGREKSSEEIAGRMKDLMVSGKGDLAFVIGGSDGVSPKIYDRADELLSFGKITLPHNLARVVLLEQIYRAFKIMRGEPYHK